MRFAIVFLLLDVLTNADVIRLVKAGLSPATIEAKIAASETKFDTSTDALVALAKEDVPDAVIRAMIEYSAPAVPPVPPVPVVAPVPPVPPVPPTAFVRRFEVAIHRGQYAKCEGGELRVDGKGLKATRCKDLDFNVAWSEVESACVDYGFRGTVVFRTKAKEHRVSVPTPAEARKILEAVRAVRPSLEVKECEE